MSITSLINSEQPKRKIAPKKPYIKDPARIIPPLILQALHRGNVTIPAIAPTIPTAPAIHASTFKMLDIVISAVYLFSIAGPLSAHRPISF